MATTTTNYGLTKPGYGDTADIADINGNMDTIDSVLQGQANAFGIVVNGDKTTFSTGAAIGQYIVLQNSTINGCDDGLYKAAKAIPYNTSIDSTYLTAVDGGGLNVLNASLTLIDSTTGNSVIAIPDDVNQILVLLKAGSEYASLQLVKGFYADYIVNGYVRATNANWYGFDYIVNYSASGIYLKDALNANTQASVVSITEVRVYGK